MDLNPFEIKAEISKIFQELKGVTDFENYEIHYRLLDSQNDKEILIKLLFKEISNRDSDKNLVKFLIMRYCPVNKTVEHLWNIIKNNLSTNQAKIFALDFLRDIDTNWTYDDFDKYLDNPDEFIDSDTRKILDSAIANPEVQIDFMDFLSSLPDDDKITLLNSLANDYSEDELANMLIPVFLSSQTSETGKTALEILGNSKSRLAFHALNSALENADESIVPLIKKNISTLKLSGIREDNSKEFYKNLLKNSKPYKFCLTYPDGHGNQAVIFSRLEQSGKVRFVAIVIDDYKGIRDCFGFNEISQFECNAIIERFYRGQRALNVKPEILKTILNNAEKLSYKLPYEYVCWKNLLSDIEPERIKLNYEIKKLSDNEFEDILKYDFTDYWFLNADYSDEFEDLIKLSAQTETKDFDRIIDENVDKVFYTEEKRVWTERILNVAILKHLAGDETAAKNLYSLYNDKELIREFFKNILRKSLYEYWFAQKDELRITEIEEMWVK